MFHVKELSSVHIILYVSKNGVKLERTLIESKKTGVGKEQVMFLSGSLLKQDKSFQKTALNKLDAPAVLATLCRRSHGEVHLPAQKKETKQKQTSRHPISMRGSRSDDTSVVNELAVKNRKGEEEERRAVMDLPRTSFKQTQTSALKLLLCFQLHPEAILTG